MRGPLQQGKLAPFASLSLPQFPHGMETTLPPGVL